MKTKLLFYLAVWSVIVFGLTSCSRVYHPDLVGRYHPHTSANEPLKITASVHQYLDQSGELPAKETLTASNGISFSPEVQPIILAHEKENQSFNAEQQEKVGKILDLIEKKTNKNSRGEGTLATQSKWNPHSSNEKNVKHASDDRLLYFLLAILLPPLAVVLWEDEITINFWLDIIFTLLFWIPGIIFAWIVILGKE